MRGLVWGRRSTGLTTGCRRRDCRLLPSQGLPRGGGRKHCSQFGRRSRQGGGWLCRWLAGLSLSVGRLLLRSRDRRRLRCGRGWRRRARRGTGATTPACLPCSRRWSHTPLADPSPPPQRRPATTAAGWYGLAVWRAARCSMAASAGCRVRSPLGCRCPWSGYLRCPQRSARIPPRCPLHCWHRPRPWCGPWLGHWMLPARVLLRCRRLQMNSTGGQARDQGVLHGMQGPMPKIATLPSPKNRIRV
mmetsp:Transcript_12469/g.38907  ORF Transcript_12469/g.38907 Transcript_12469/m.38907 type:complete len:246 (+) Transcript_12469:1196-1933(+)